MIPSLETGICAEFVTIQLKIRYLVTRSINGRFPKMRLLFCLELLFSLIVTESRLSAFTKK
jgi:hypothetical protein